MQETKNYDLPLYELDDMANLDDGYNNAMQIIDGALQKNKEDIASYFPVENVNIADGAISTRNIQSKNVTNEELADASVDNRVLAAGAVEAANIAEGAIDFNDIPADTITRAMINADAFDAAPTANSENLVTSGGVYEAIADSNPAGNNILVAIGDSFGVDSVTAPNWWHTYLSQYWHMVDKAYCEGSSGFLAVGSGGHTFSTLIDKAANDESFDNSKVGKLVIYGGLNDRDLSGLSQTALTNAMVSTLINAKESFPNAEITLATSTSWYALTLRTASQTVGTYQDLVCLAARAACAKVGAVRFVDMRYATFGDTTYYNGTADGQHFTEEGSKAAALCIINGHVGYRRINSTSSLKDVANSTFNMIHLINDCEIKTSLIIPTTVSTNIPTSGHISVMNNLHLRMPNVASLIFPMRYNQGANESGFSPSFSYDEWDINGFCALNFLNANVKTNVVNGFISY